MGLDNEGNGPSGSLGYGLALTDPSLTCFDGSVVVSHNRKSLSISQRKQ